jgi:predicted phosphodiesterase
MPITLPPISRRRFLRGALAAAGAIALDPVLSWGNESAPNPHRLALISDIHLDADPASVSRNVNMLDHFRKVSQQVIALKDRPSMVLINGDCAHAHGRPQDYAAVSKALAPMRSAGFPIHLGLGNHDSRENLLAGLGQDKDHASGISDRRVMKLKLPTCDWYMLDSLQQTNKTPGLLGPEQLKWLAGSLDAGSDHPAVVMLHHQPDGHAGVKISGLVDTPAFLDIVQPRKQVKAIVFGHTHSWLYYEKEGLHFVNLPTTAYVFHPEQPAGWVDAHLGEKSMKLQLHAITPNKTGQKETLDLPWR